MFKGDNGQPTLNRQKKARASDPTTGGADVAEHKFRVQLSCLVWKQLHHPATVHFNDSRRAWADTYTTKQKRRHVDDQLSHTGSHRSAAARGEQQDDTNAKK